MMWMGMMSESEMIEVVGVEDVVADYLEEYFEELIGCLE